VNAHRMNTVVKQHNVTIYTQYKMFGKFPLVAISK